MVNVVFFQFLGRGWTQFDLVCLLKPVHTVAAKCDSRRISPLSRSFRRHSQFSATALLVSVDFVGLDFVHKLCFIVTSTFFLLFKRQLLMFVFWSVVSHIAWIVYTLHV